MEIDSNIEFLTAVITQFSENPDDRNNGSAFSEVNKMLDELRQLSSAFNTRSVVNMIYNTNLLCYGTLVYLTNLVSNFIFYIICLVIIYLVKVLFITHSVFK